MTREIGETNILYCRYTARWPLRHAALADNHRLNGSSSPVFVLTAIHHSYGNLAWLSDSPPPGLWLRPEPIFKQNGSNDVDSRKGVPFAVNRYFSYSLISGPRLKSEIWKNFGRSITPLLLEIIFRENVWNAAKTFRIWQKKGKNV